MKYMLGKKKNMSQMFTENGVFPMTVIEAGPITTLLSRTQEKDAYSAVQVGFEKKSEKKSKKNGTNFQYIREFRTKTDEKAEPGSVIDVSIFAEGDMISISGVSKGKGFQGVVKRHGFKGGPRTHGQKHSEREAGSIGGGGRAGGRVVKGMRMPGRMGGDRVTVKGLKVVAVDAPNNLLYVCGAVPGRPGTLLEIRGVK